jgi:hypothetical protein
MKEPTRTQSSQHQSPPAHRGPPDQPYESHGPDGEHPMDKPEKPTLDPKEAEALLRAGTKLVKKGEDPKTHWVTMTRVGDQLAICVAATDEAVAEIIKRDLVLAE